MPALSPEHLAQFIGVGLKRVDVDLTRFEPLAFVGLVVFHPEFPSSCSDGGDQALDTGLSSSLLLLVCVVGTLARGSTSSSDRIGDLFSTYVPL